MGLIIYNNYQAKNFQMKNILFIQIVLIMIFSIAACKKNDLSRSADSNTSTIDPQAIIGKWNVTDIATTMKSKDSKVTTTNRKITNQHWEFKGDGYLHIQSGSSFETIQYKIMNSNRIILSYKNAVDTLELTINTNKLTFLENKLLYNGNTLNESVNLVQD
jgi:uncharacterized lipoprotein YehR (DUF1307 family)